MNPILAIALIFLALVVGVVIGAVLQIHSERNRLRAALESALEDLSGLTLNNVLSWRMTVYGVVDSLLAQAYDGRYKEGEEVVKATTLFARLGREAEIQITSLNTRFKARNASMLQCPLNEYNLLQNLLRLNGQLHEDINTSSDELDKQLVEVYAIQLKELLKSMTTDGLNTDHVGIVTQKVRELREFVPDEYGTFYFNLQTLAFPDALDRFIRSIERAAEKWIQPPTITDSSSSADST